MAWFLNSYECDHCEERWEDEWSCMADDECPSCGAGDMVPHLSQDLTFLVVEREGIHVVLRSPDTAEDEPEYQLAGEFPTRALAEAYVVEAATQQCDHREVIQDSGP
jgi:hypothetical protein